MPIKIPNDLPAAHVLATENIFVMDEQRAVHQDIRPLKILVLNLMPTKIETEIQLLRLLSGTPLQVEITLLQAASHTSKNTSFEHLGHFYQMFDGVKDCLFDGMIITGAPVETLPFEEVDYWPELCEVMEWSSSHVYSCFHICWGAQAGLYYHYGINKYGLPDKLTGVFSHHCLEPYHPLTRGFDDIYYAPHSRYTAVCAEDIASRPDLRVLSVSDDAGVHIAANADCRRIFITGHSEYDRLTLAAEFERDSAKSEHPPMPVRYFPHDDPTLAPVINWRAHANLLFCNWINFVIYENTPYDLAKLGSIIVNN